MKNPKFNIRIVILLIVVITIFIGFPSYSTAQKQTSTFSGRVIDTEDNPVAELPVFIAPQPDIKFKSNSIQHLLWIRKNYSDSPLILTDLDGRFSITDIPSGSMFFGSHPYNIDKLLSDRFEFEQEDFESDVEILSLQIKGITYHSRRRSNTIPFGLKPGTHIENVLVTVKPRMRIRGRVLFKDRTPVANARFRISFFYDTEDGRGHGSSGGGPKTDAKGYFVYYLKERNDPAFYTFSVEYMGLIAKSDSILLKPGERLDGLTFTFNSAPIAPKPPRKQETIVKKSNTPPVQEHLSRQKPEEVWIVNPANRHAYKRVHCKTRDDAIAQAIKEKAHFVTINDVKEQEWLEKVFGYGFYWIGLSNTKKEGKWQWHNGEPLTYQNWLPNDYFSEAFDVNERNYAVMTFIDGKWYAVSPKSVIAQMTEMAIIEKADVKIKQSTKKK